MVIEKEKKILKEGDIRIERLSPDGWEKCRDLRLKAVTLEPQAFANTPKSIQDTPEAEWRKYLSNTWQGNGKEVYFAKVDGQVVGMAGVYRLPPERAKEGHIASIEAVYVKPGFRRQGIGTELILKILELVKQDPTITIIKLEVGELQTDAIAMYESLGFKSTGVNPWAIKVGDQYYNSVFMSKIMVP